MDIDAHDTHKMNKIKAKCFNIKMHLVLGMQIIEIQGPVFLLIQ